MSAGRRRGGGPGPRPGPAWDEVHPTLDLHGETADGARVKAERWLRDRRAEGARTVRIVTGRGLHSVGPPVLPGEIAGLLRRLKGSVVADWAGEPGGGVYRVELRRAGRGRPAAGAPMPGNSAVSRSVPARDPELRRRAEESLADLGIKPTPALLAAEMRRLAGETG